MKVRTAETVPSRPANFRLTPMNRRATRSAPRIGTGAAVLWPPASVRATTSSRSNFLSWSASPSRTAALNAASNLACTSCVAGRGGLASRAHGSLVSCQNSLDLIGRHLRLFRKMNDELCARTAVFGHCPQELHGEYGFRGCLFPMTGKCSDPRELPERFGRMGQQVQRVAHVIVVPNSHTFDHAAGDEVTHDFPFPLSKAMRPTRRAPLLPRMNRH